MTSPIERLRRDEAWRERCEVRAREFDEAIERRAAGIPPALIEDKPHQRSEAMRFRRCKVVQAGGVTLSTSPRHAWVPVERAIADSTVRLQFPMEDEWDYVVMECDALVIDGRSLPHVVDEPMGSAHR